ncbi:MAG: hypothetical protein L0228_20435, partial [Planctomycetes bacterium]|nr:hypothetical protein [Planctomycetota bacterium]
ARSLPEDPAGYHYVQLMGTSASTPLSVAAKHVLQQIVHGAAANRALPVAPDRGLGGISRHTGDALAEFYVREAARAADALPDDVAPRAFLLALAIGMDDSRTLTSVPGVADAVAAVEAPSERMVRLTLLGEPTLRGRRDLAQHFFISAYLAAAIGHEAAQAAGIAKELLDSQGTSGFSFADIAADRAGTRFANGVLKNRFPLGALAKSFDVKTFVPEIEGLPEGLTAAQFKSQYGTKTGPKVLEQLKDIDRRIEALPPYRPSTLRLGP